MSTSTSSSPTCSSSTRCASGCRLSIPHPLSTLPAVLKFHPLRPSDLVPSSRTAIKTPLPLLAQALATTRITLRSSTVSSPSPPGCNIVSLTVHQVKVKRATMATMATTMMASMHSLTRSLHTPPSRPTTCSRHGLMDSRWVASKCIRATTPTSPQAAAP